jgi:hypothetical protein
MRANNPDGLYALKQHRSARRACRAAPLAVHSIVVINIAMDLEIGLYCR